MSLKKVFRSLTKHQHAVMEVLCSVQNPRIAAANLKPATLGSLCAKKLVNVDDGIVSSTCVMLWNMTFHKEMFDMITQEHIDKLGYLIWSGRRIVAVMVLRECTGWGIHEAREWMNLHYPI